MQPIKTLIHIHTDYSFDSNITLEGLTRFAERTGFGCLAVTDHDSIDGAKRLAGMTNVKVIVGEEISTQDGHLIGLFLKEVIKPGMNARDTALAIRDQGGLVLLPHPFVAAFGCGLRNVSWEIADWVDAVEINNAQNLLPGPDRKARTFARRFSLPTYVGTDTHMNTSIAPCYQLMPDFTGPAEFLESLKQADLVPGRHPLSYFAAAATRVARHLSGLSLPIGFGANTVVQHRAQGSLAHTFSTAAV